MQRRTAARGNNGRGFDPPPSNVDASNAELGWQRKDPRGKVRRKKSKEPDIVWDIGNMVITKVSQVVHGFFHDRTGVEGCRLAGIIRFSYAVLYLYSVILLTIQMRLLFDPYKGLISYEIAGDTSDDLASSIFEWAPESSLLVYVMFFLGIFSGILLLAGIQPRLGALGAFYFLSSMQAHNNKIWDHEIRMNKMWAFFLIFLPLDHFTIEDEFNGLVPVVRKHLKLPPQPRRQRSRDLSTSWPMWPFRLWQIYTCMVYVGAGLGKFNTETWTSGNAISYLWYDETVGRLYPAFVVDLLFNRLFMIKIQTWISLLVENLCYITIWPLKTRKITFVALVLLHIGIELSLVMHIFEYLSVLGWVCFFVYPDDGKANAEGLVKNKKSEVAKLNAKNIFGSSRAKLFEALVAVSLLYLIIFDIFPREEMEELMPAPFAYLVWAFVYPPAFVKTKLNELVFSMGIHAGPFILFKGQPEHKQARMTAVIRFNDDTEPILYKEAEWATSSFVRREIDYWYDTYSFYLMEEIGDPENLPFWAAMSVHLAEVYSEGGITRRYNEITVDPSNTVESVSIQVHRRAGSDEPAPPGWGLFASIRREWSYESSCEYVFIPKPVDEPEYFQLDAMWDGAINKNNLKVRNGCAVMNPEDEILHRQGQYGEPDEDDAGDDDNATNEEENNPQGNDDGEDNGEQERYNPYENANDDGDTDQEGAAEYQNLNNMEENDPEENDDNRANIENDDGESGGLDQQDREDGPNGEGFYNPRRNIENDDEESDARIQEDRNDGTNDDEAAGGQEENDEGRFGMQEENDGSNGEGRYRMREEIDGPGEETEPPLGGDRFEDGRYAPPDTPDDNDDKAGVVGENDQDINKEGDGPNNGDDESQNNDDKAGFGGVGENDQDVNEEGDSPNTGDDESHNKQLRSRR